VSARRKGVTTLTAAVLRRLPDSAARRQAGLQVLVGDTVVEVSGDLAPGELDAALRSLRPIDADGLVRVALDADLRSP
jgi:hypothetical protein